MKLTDIVELFRLHVYSHKNENKLVDARQNINSSFTEEQSLENTTGQTSKFSQRQSSATL